MSELRAFLTIGIALVLLGTGVPALAGDGDSRAERRARMLEKHDTDGDGKLSAEKREALRASRGGGQKGRRGQMLETFDRDGDGKLSDEERRAAREHFQKSRQERGGGFGRP